MKSQGQAVASDPDNVHFEQVYAKLEQEEIIEECRVFLLKKFGINGYARSKMYFEDSMYQKYLEDITNLASNKDEFAKEIKSINGIK